LVGSSTFISLGTHSYDPGSGNDGKITLTSSLGPIATGVDAIRFVILDNGDSNLETGYSELDVFGTATTVPEPSSHLFLGLGAIGLLMVARRRRSA
jgi:hypothetical protein